MQTLKQFAPASTRPFELAVTLTAMYCHETAMEVLEDFTAKVPLHPDAWRLLAALQRLAGADDAARAALATAERCRHAASRWHRAADTRSEAELETAEHELQAALKGKPAESAMEWLRELLCRRETDVVAMRLLAYFERYDGDVVTSLALLERALELAPGYVRARMDFATLLMERRLHVRALAETEILIAARPNHAMCRAMRADALACIGNYDAAIDMMAALLREDARRPKFLLSYAKALHYAGRRDESVQAYRDCLALVPTMGEAYWGLADLKGDYITEADLAAMRAHLAGSELDADDRVHMLYAVGFTLERAGAYGESFAAYEAGGRAFQKVATAIRKAHDPEATAARVRRHQATFTAENIATKMAARGPVSAPAVSAASGAPAATPIFVVGMPRAGSTLLEQILASHSLVEGVGELPVMMELTRELALSRALVATDCYPECVLGLTPAELAAIGDRYMRSAAAYRKTDRPYFVDKRPWNWLDAGLIKLILPQAKIIDVRRAPMAACFAMFKQVMPADAAFTYDLAHLGRYYSDYVTLMQHWARVMPGAIHAIRYEELVDDTETEIRRLLDYCGLPFEDSCLRYWETDRAVATPSAEQVRRPIYRGALEQWRHFEPWLGPLKDALGPNVVTAKS